MNTKFKIGDKVRCIHPSMREEEEFVVGYIHKPYEKTIYRPSEDSFGEEEDWLEFAQKEWD